MNLSVSNALFLPIVLLAAGVALRCLMRLAYGARGPLPNDGLYRGAMFVSGLFIAAALTVPMLPLMLGAGPAVLLFLGYATLEWLLAKRELQRRTIWGILTNAQRRGLPLEQVLPRHVNRFSGVVGRAFRWIEALIRIGRPLRDSLAINPRAIPREGLAAVALAGDAPLPTDARLFGDLPDSFRALWARLTASAGYLLFVSLCGTSILVFVMIKIVPEFEKIYTEFGLELPSITIGLVKAAALITGSTAGGVVLLALAWLMLGLVVCFFFYLFDVPILQPLLDRLMWFRHRAQVLWLLAEAADRKLPLTEALSRMSADLPAPRYASRLVVRRLRAANKQLIAGEPWVDALRSARLIRRCDISALETARAAGNLPWVLRQLAEQNLKSGMYGWQVASEICLPLVMFLFGMIVALICISLFVPLVALIENLS